MIITQVIYMFLVEKQNGGGGNTIVKKNLILDIPRLWISSSVSKIPRYIHSTMFVYTVH